jgi:hypothetical protein
VTLFRTLSCALALALLAHQQPAHAYIDPATGSLILQGLVAFFVGAAFTLKTFFREKIRPIIDWILRRPRPATPAEPPVDAAKH